MCDRKHKIKVEKHPIMGSKFIGREMLCSLKNVPKVIRQMNLNYTSVPECEGEKVMNDKDWLKVPYELCFRDFSF